MGDFFYLIMVKYNRHEQKFLFERGERMLFIRTFILLLVAIIGGVKLQIFLSKGKSKWPGLILPIITFVFSLTWMLNISSMGSIIQTIALIFSMLFVTNIPTVILLAIYFRTKSKIA